MDTIDMTVLVEAADGEPLLWLETDANGNTTLNDVSGLAVQRWMLGWGWKRWPFTATWSREGLRPEDWDEWCKDDFRIDTPFRYWSASIYVWGVNREDAYDYLVSRLEPGMLIKDEDKDEDEDEELAALPE